MAPQKHENSMEDTGTVLAPTGTPSASASASAAAARAMRREKGDGPVSHLRLGSVDS